VRECGRQGVWGKYPSLFKHLIVAVTNAAETMKAKFR